MLQLFSEYFLGDCPALRRPFAMLLIFPLNLETSTQSFQSLYDCSLSADVVTGGTFIYIQPSSLPPPPTPTGPHLLSSAQPGLPIKQRHFLHARPRPPLLFVTTIRKKHQKSAHRSSFTQEQRERISNGRATVQEEDQSCSEGPAQICCSQWLYFV